MKNTDPQSPKLTRNQTLVLQTLTESEAPLSAYAILDHLRDQGFKAPLQVYRALDRLVAIEKVHRLESLNAFVACCQPDNSSHDTTAFTICDDCGHVDELSSSDLVRQIYSCANASGFVPRKTTIELHGTCQACNS